MRSIFGWSLPPGCKHLPGEDEPDGPVVLNCSCCGSFLPHKADRTEPWKDKVHCNGKVLESECGPISACGNYQDHPPHDVVAACGYTEYRRCSRCGTENQKIIA